MYTGIIQSLGRVVAKTAAEQGVVFAFSLGLIDKKSVQLGDSVAVNGVCLTVTQFDEAAFCADVSIETLDKTTLGQLEIDDVVNLELCMRPTDRFGGHWVQGHVDDVGCIESISPAGDAYQVWVGFPAHLAKYIAIKGSICVDGVSLTVNAVEHNRFRLTIIPHTWAATIFQCYQVGSRVNLEVDIVARYLERMLAVKEER